MASQVKPLVSILVPAYNAERWVAQSIRSALEQTWSNTEIVVVDDGSSDGTYQIAEQFRGERVIIIRQENQGAAAARNRAFSLCKGDYVQWLDADDLLAPDKVSNQMAIIEEAHDKSILFSSGWGHFFSRPSKAQFRPSVLWNDLTPLEWIVRKMESGSHMQTATWLVSRELTEAAGPWNTQLLGDDDGEYFCRLMTKSCGVRFVSESKVYYRAVGPNRLSYVGNSDRKMEAGLLSIKLQIGYLLSIENSEMTRAACVKYLQNYLIDFHPQRPDIVHEMCQLAYGLGGSLRPPRLSWKYAWIQKIFGLATAKRCQLSYNKIKSSLLQGWDTTMWLLESRRRPHLRT